MPHIQRRKCHICDSYYEHLPAVITSPQDSDGNARIYMICRRCWESLFTLVLDRVS